MITSLLTGGFYTHLWVNGSDTFAKYVVTMHPIINR